MNYPPLPKELKQCVFKVADNFLLEYFTCLEVGLITVIPEPLRHTMQVKIYMVHVAKTVWREGEEPQGWARYLLRGIWSIRFHEEDAVQSIMGIYVRGVYGEWALGPCAEPQPHNLNEEEGRKGKGVFLFQNFRYFYQGGGGGQNDFAQ